MLQPNQSRYLSKACKMGAQGAQRLESAGFARGAKSAMRSIAASFTKRVKRANKKFGQFIAHNFPSSKGEARKLALSIGSIFLCVIFLNFESLQKLYTNYTSHVSPTHTTTQVLIVPKGKYIPQSFCKPSQDVLRVNLTQGIGYDFRRLRWEI